MATTSSPIPSGPQCAESRALLERFSEDLVPEETDFFAGSVVAPAALTPAPSLPAAFAVPRSLLCGGASLVAGVGLVRSNTLLDVFRMTLRASADALVLRAALLGQFVVASGAGTVAVTTERSWLPQVRSFLEDPRAARAWEAFGRGAFGLAEAQDLFDAAHEHRQESKLPDSGREVELSVLLSEGGAADTAAVNAAAR